MPSAEFTQEGNRFVIQAPRWDPDLFIIREMTARESISGLYRLTIEAYSNTSDINFKDVIGQPMAVAMRLREGKTRCWHGVVARLTQGPSEGDLCAYQLEVVPWLWYLTRSSDCRIFQKKSTPEIIEAVFEGLGMTDFDLRLRKHEPRPYTVQYRETDFNFVCRLMEEAGISYFFEHDEKKHTLVLFDDASSNYSVASGSEAALCEDEDEARRMGQLAECSVQQVLPSGKYTINDYDYEDPGCHLLAPTTSSIALGGNDFLEIYDYPGEYTTIGEGEAKVKLRMEAEEAASHKIEGRGYRGDFSAGFTFDLTEHYRADFNTTYLITSIVHRATQTIGSSEGESEQYSNTFTCIPYEVPYRPLQLTPKPTISGAQTATVVGASGEEIDVDDQGRVVVQFHWDREGKMDEKSSCRVRVSQSWAGEKWGGMFFPRIGQEVIVEFLEGDPDQPIITGRVYNGKHHVPYALPANKTLSGIKTLSSKGGEGFNELRFEDKKGEEQIFIHGEKNLDIRVKNDFFEEIEHDKHLIVKNNRVTQIENESHETVDQDQFEKVGKDHHLEVVGKQAIKITGSRSLTVEGDVIEEFKANHSEQTTGDLYLKADGLVIEASSGLTLKVGGSSVVLDSSGVTVTGSMVTIDGSMVKIASGPGSSPASGSAGSIVAPTLPELPEEADIADPGKIAEIKREQHAKKSGKYGAVPVVPFKPRLTEEVEIEEKSWIEIELVDEEDNPIPGERYEITLPDGTTVARGTLDENGFARVDGIDPGTCQVTFPKLDEGTWEKA